MFWFLGHGPSRVLVPGACTFPCFGSWGMYLSVFWFLGHGPSRVLVPGSWTFPFLVPGSCTFPCFGSWIMDLNSRVLVPGSWTFPCFGSWVMDFPVFWFSCHGPFLFHGPRVSFCPRCIGLGFLTLGPKLPPRLPFLRVDLSWTPPPFPKFCIRSYFVWLGSLTPAPDAVYQPARG